MLKKILSSTIIKLVLAVIAGILLGFVVGEGFMNVVVTLKYILGQLIFFMVPLIILAFISSSIAKMKGNASRMLGWALGLASFVCRSCFYGHVFRLLADPVTDY